MDIKKLRAAMHMDSDGMDIYQFLPNFPKTGPFFDGFQELDSIGLKNGTDKASNRHDYLKKYEYFLKNFVDKEINVLELGILRGSSLKMWGEYFPKAKIFGVDVNHNCVENIQKNINVIIMDLSKEENVVLLNDVRASIIVDDASHIWSHQIIALFLLFPKLKPGSVYILEDLETNFEAFRNYTVNYKYQDASFSAYDVLQAIAEIVTSREYLRSYLHNKNLLRIENEIIELARNIDMISFIHGSCILIKNGLSTNEGRESLLTRRPIVGWVSHLAYDGWAGMENEIMPPHFYKNEIQAVRIYFTGAFISIKYATYVAEEGWGKSCVNGEISGTVNQRKPLSGIWIKLDEENEKYSISYRVYYEKWSEWMHDGEKISNDVSRMKGIQIKLIKKVNYSPDM